MQKVKLQVILLFLFSNLIYGQTYNLPEKKFYTNAIVAMQDFNKYEVSNLTIESDSVRFVNRNTSMIEVLPLQQVNYLRVQTGNSMGEWALYGGLLMGASVLLGVIEVKSDPNVVMKDNANQIIVGFIAGGIVVGGLIGAAIPSWKTYYINTGTGYINRIKPDLYIASNSLGFKLDITIKNYPH